ncbi:MAG: helicase-exonuclease AddAB subunit AddB [Bacillota bacterium]|nr:helicase-exonuclease AddAB subunit AddB [Bacillota bacterium]MDW7683520.1 helicase-exonuclease AddAB subunit AddB [Bacillota bacterium]
MTVRFILGRAGSGKTSACQESIAHISKTEPVGSPLIFLTPEQATFQMERELAVRCGGGTFRAQVLSFRRLAHHLLQTYGGHAPVMSELGRQMALRRMLQQYAGSLETFGKAARQPRFCEELAVQIRELKNYRIEPEQLRNMARAEDTPARLRGKLADLAVIFAEYASFTAGRYTDPEDTLTLLAKAVSNGALPQGTRVWVDGFAGFTEQEYQVIGSLLQNTEHVEIALCLDPAHLPEDPGEDELFHPTLDTYRRLRRVCGSAGVRVLPAVQLPADQKNTRFSREPALSHLEETFDRLPPARYTEEVKSVSLATAAGTRTEVEAAARDILHLVREKGWRFRDIGIILRDFNRYHDLVAAVFTDYGIPCFIDNRRDAAHHPLLELLRSALDAAQTNLQSRSVFQMLKTDFFPLARVDADRLENYVRAHGIRGGRWIDGQPWSYRLHLSLAEEQYTAGDEEFPAEINRAKEVFAAYYGPLHRNMAQGGRRAAHTFCQALWSFMESLGVEETLQHWTAADEARNDRLKASEHRQVWQGIMEILDQVSEILGDQEMNLQEFCQVVLSGMEALTLGLVPAGLDQVVVGNVERSRQPNLRAAYVLGMSEGDFPARAAEEGLFADEERDVMAASGMELAASRRQKLFHEQYLSYIALTRSCEYLWVSCPLADEEGKAKRPSSLFNRLREMFPGVAVEFYGNTPDEEGDLHFLAGRNNTAAALLLQAGKLKAAGHVSPFWQAVYHEAILLPDMAARMQLLWPSLSHNNSVSSLSGETVQALFGRPLASSISRLELFARCPFAHFARYGLRLKEREEFSVDAPEMGTFLHAALKIFVEELLQEGVDWRKLEVCDAQERMAAIVERLIPLLNGEILLSTARLRYLADKLKKTLAEAVAGLTEHARRGEFNPAAVEMSFGDRKIPPLQIPLTSREKLLLRGQIDRIDVAESGDRMYFRVIDYKSNPLELKLSDVWHGLSLQLLAYLSVVRENAALFSEKEPVCAGAFYFALQHPFRRVDNPADAAAPDNRRLRLDGLMLAETDAYQLMGGSPELVRASLKKDGTFTKTSRVASMDELDGLLSAVHDTLAELAAAVIAGRADVFPYKKADGSRACTFCEYMPVCRFDLSVAGNCYRNLPVVANRQVLQDVAGQKGESSDEQ